MIDPVKTAKQFIADNRRHYWHAPNSMKGTEICGLLAELVAKIEQVESTSYERGMRDAADLVNAIAVPGFASDHKSDGYAQALEDAEKTILSAIPNHKQGGVCEWSKPGLGLNKSYRRVGCADAIRMIYHDEMKFCPYCSKPIKIKETTP